MTIDNSGPKDVQHNIALQLKKVLLILNESYKFGYQFLTQILCGFPLKHQLNFSGGKYFKYKTDYLNPFPLREKI